MKHRGWRKLCRALYEGTLGALPSYPLMKHETKHQATTTTKETEENAKLLLEVRDLLAFLRIKKMQIKEFLAKSLILLIKFC